MNRTIDFDFSNEYKTIGLNVAYYRKMRGLTQLQLAELLNISRTHISNIEATGMNTSISMDLLFRIAKSLDIPSYKLLKSPMDE